MLTRPASLSPLIHPLLTGHFSGPEAPERNQVDEFVDGCAPKASQTEHAGPVSTQSQAAFQSNVTLDHVHELQQSRGGWATGIPQKRKEKGSLSN